VPGSDFILIRSTAGDPKSAARLANAFAKVFVKSTLDDQRRTLRSAVGQARLQMESLTGRDRETIRQRQVLQRRVDELGALLALARSTAQQIDTALPAGAPIAPRPTRNAVFGFFVGLLAASALAFALSRLEFRRVRSADDIERLFGVPLLTVIPRVRKPKVDMSPETAPPHALREPLRRLDTTLGLLEGPGPNSNGNGSGTRRKVLLITSAERGDGKSTLVRNLALIQQEAGKRVIVLDSDLRAPTQEQLLNVQRAPGLSDVLASRSPLSAAVQFAGVPTGAGAQEGDAETADIRPRLAVLAAGRPSANPPALMTGPKLGAVLDEIREGYDQVLIDSPPPLAVSDVLPLLAQVDGIILVSRVDHTHSRYIEKLLALLERFPNAPVLGVVANDVHPDDIQHYGYPSS
jgi:capsular exopolysaccharide synthesis family protein